MTGTWPLCTLYNQTVQYTKQTAVYRKVHHTVKMMGIVHSNAWHKEDQTVLFCLLKLCASFFISLSALFLAHGLLNE